MDKFFDYIANFKVTVDTLHPAVVAFMEQEAQKLSVTIKERTISGKSETGGSFSPYTSKSHRAKRRKAGLGTSNKNFKFTGAMWNNFNLNSEKTISEPNKVTVVIGFNDNKANKIASGHDSVEKRRGTVASSIISPSKNETGVFWNKVNKFISDYLKKNGI
jgi:hypothetical protein